MQPETAETRAKLAGAIRQLQAKGDNNTINQLVSAYKQKYKPQPSYTQRVAGEYQQAGKDITQGIQQGTSEYQQGVDQANTATTLGGKAMGELKATGGLLKSGLRTVGAVAGATFAPLTEAVSPLLQKPMEALSNTKVGQSVINPLTELANKHPESAKTINDIVNILTLGAGGAVEKPVLGAVEKGGQKVASTLESQLSKVAPALEKRASDKADKAIIDAITPDLSKTKATQLVKQGGAIVEKGTIFDTVGVKTTPRMIKVKDAIKDVFNKKATFTENVNNIKSAIGTEAENLKSMIANVDHPYTFKELKSKLNSVDLPISFKNDVQQSKTLRDITDTAMKISQEKGGNISSLLDARKEFDNLVEENFPNLYDKGKPTTTYYAITRTRNAMNDFIENQLPKDINFKNSLEKQSLMYDAVDSMASKAGEEVGTKSNVLTRKAKEIYKKHPKTSTAIGAVASYEGAKKLGVPLP